MTAVREGQHRPWLRLLAGGLLLVVVALGWLCTGPGPRPPTPSPQAPPRVAIPATDPPPAPDREAIVHVPDPEQDDPTELLWALGRVSAGPVVSCLLPAGEGVQAEVGTGLIRQTETTERGRVHRFVAEEPEGTGVASVFDATTQRSRLVGAFEWGIGSDGRGWCRTSEARTYRVDVTVLGPDGQPHPGWIGSQRPPVYRYAAAGDDGHVSVELVAGRATWLLARWVDDLESEVVAVHGPGAVVLQLQPVPEEVRRLRRAAEVAQRQQLVDRMWLLAVTDQALPVGMRAQAAAAAVVGEAVEARRRWRSAFEP